jgi:hypothetical protein
MCEKAMSQTSHENAAASGHGIYFGLSLLTNFIMDLTAYSS